MARSLWEVFLSIFQRTSEDDADSDEDHFVPSPMDLSVRISHAGPDDQIDRELNRIEKEVQKLEEYRDSEQEHNG